MPPRPHLGPKGLSQATRLRPGVTAPCPPPPAQAPPSPASLSCIRLPKVTLPAKSCPAPKSPRPARARSPERRPEWAWWPSGSWAEGHGQVGGRSVREPSRFCQPQARDRCLGPASRPAYPGFLRGPAGVFEMCPGRAWLSGPRGWRVSSGLSGQSSLPRSGGCQAVRVPVLALGVPAISRLAKQPRGRCSGAGVSPISPDVRSSSC